MNKILQNPLILNRLANAKVKARALIFGGQDYKNITGEVDFYNFLNGTMVVCLIKNLPQTNSNFFGFHIHSQGECSGDFSSAGEHLGSGEHPSHQGDMPVLLSCDGTAFMAFYTNRFTPNDIIKKSVIIHLMPDDFTTQPSGNSGKRIACGVIEKV